MTAHEKMVKARSALVLDSPFFGSLVLRLDMKEDNSQPTLATNGIGVFYNTQFVDSLPMEELKGVLCHEVMHVALGHHVRRGNRKTGKWNTAADHAINPIILDAGFRLPKHPPNPGLGTFVEEIYNRLPDEDDGQGEGKGKGPGQPGQQKGQPGSDPGGCGTVFDYPGDTPAERQQQEQDWKIALSNAAQAAKACGKLPGSLARLVEDINEARVPWREVLQRFVNQCARNDYTWRRPNSRYFSQGIILPALYSEQLPPITIAVDTSGSIGTEELKQFAGEIDEIIGQYNATVNVIYCDTKIQHTETFTPETRPVKLDTRGGGGTSFAPVFEHISTQGDDPACVVYLTDLCCSDFGTDPGCPVLWVATEGKHHKVPFGEIVYL